MSSPLFDFAFFPDWEGMVNFLSKMAQPENWGYRYTPTTKDLPILKSYLHYTFSRLKEESKIIYGDNGDTACFNTGLVTPNYEEIFGFFVKNNRGRQPYVFNGFVKESDNKLTRFGKLPDLASYFTKTSDLVFDTKKDLRYKVDHIIDENKNRFPAPFNTMDNYQLKISIDGAIKHALRRVERNYRTAVPQFYRGNIQLLLPLCMASRAKADLALAVKDEGEVYIAYTCLTLDMAYNNARLIAKPDSDWLEP